MLNRFDGMVLQFCFCLEESLSNLRRFSCFLNFSSEIDLLSVRLE